MHLECRLEPINDPNLKVEWFVNGIEIKAGELRNLFFLEDSILKFLLCYKIFKYILVIFVGDYHKIDKMLKKCFQH